MREGYSDTHSGWRRHSARHQLVHRLQGVINGQTVGKPKQERQKYEIQLKELLNPSQNKGATSTSFTLPCHDTRMCPAVHFAGQQQGVTPQASFHCRF